VNWRTCTAQHPDFWRFSFALAPALRHTRASRGHADQSAGDILQFVLPAAAAGLTLGYKDAQGALEFGESAALTLNLHEAVRRKR